MFWTLGAPQVKGQVRQLDKASQRERLVSVRWLSQWLNVSRRSKGHEWNRTLRLMGDPQLFSLNVTIKTFQQRFSQNYENAYQILIIILLERSINVILCGVRLVSSIHVLLKGEMLLSTFILCELHYIVSVFIFMFAFLPCEALWAAFYAWKVPYK